MKIRKKTGLIICVIVAAIGVFFLLRHLLVTDEDRIKRVIYKGKAAIEHKDLEGVIKQVSRDYQDDYGLNKAAIMAIFQRVFNEFDEITIYINEMHITINEKEQGTATLLTWATVRRQDQAIYLVGNPEKPSRVIFTLAKEGGTWRVIRTQGVEPEEFIL